LVSCLTLMASCRVGWVFGSGAQETSNRGRSKVKNLVFMAFGGICQQ
jgi:hypothetical protein